MTKFKQKSKDKNFIHNPTATAQILMTEHKHPIFCFKHLHKDYSLSKCDNDEKKALLEQLVLLSQMTWEQIQLAPKHGLGAEKIYLNSLKTKCPSFITDDVSFLLCLRFDGFKPFLIHRDRFICHIIIIDSKLTSYSH